MTTSNIKLRFHNDMIMLDAYGISIPCPRAPFLFVVTPPELFRDRDASWWHRWSSEGDVTPTWSSRPLEEAYSEIIAELILS